MGKVDFRQQVKVTSGKWFKAVTPRPKTFLPEIARLQLAPIFAILRACLEDERLNALLEYEAIRDSWEQVEGGEDMKEALARAMVAPGRRTGESLVMFALDRLPEGFRKPALAKDIQGIGQAWEPYMETFVKLPSVQAFALRYLKGSHIGARALVMTLGIDLMGVDPLEVDAIRAKSPLWQRIHAAGGRTTRRDREIGPKERKALEDLGFRMESNEELLKRAKEWVAVRLIYGSVRTYLDSQVATGGPLDERNLYRRLSRFDRVLGSPGSV